uniref:SWIM-type domain-containing protein n=1 Tax=Hordeum vulgare subsp. vulgare TaxID=112509 RepID=A0A8I7B407_HORVV
MDPCDPDLGYLEPPHTDHAQTKVNSGANEDMQDICVGSQVALFMEPNFSYVALLKGYIDINGGYETINTQGRESCSSDTDNGQTNDGGEPLLQLHQTKTGGINENKKTSHEDLCMLGDFVEDQDNSPVQLEDLDAQTTTFHDILLDPWKPTLFDDILLDQVDRNNEGTRGAFEREQNHTWNLDSPTYVDDGSSRESREAETSTNACCLQVPNSENENNDINEETIDEFLENERWAAEGGNDRSIDSELKPKTGMQFSTREEAQKFLNFYAFVAGFSISVVSTARTTSKKRNGEVVRVTLKCNKYGHNTETERENLIVHRKSTVIAKTDCKAQMIVALKDGRWHITNLNLDHNHDLNPGSRFFRSHVYMSDEEKALIRTMKRCNIPTRKIVAVLAYIRGGMDKLPYNKRKVGNYGTTINRELENSDVMEVQQYFQKKQAESPGFCYSMEVDAKNKVRSVFWTDARSRTMYQEYGDCISFDTTFLTNKYNLPFAPFVGISPHGKTYLFACALIVNETANTFKWLFQQFLAAMGGKAPKSIITDQDKAMESAIKDVFPQATHRTCLFHVMKKAEEQMCRVFQLNQGLYEDFHDIVNNSLTEKEFETLWQTMIETYNVGEVKFFQDMWKTRKKFVPVYFKTKFFPFIQTTARSEGKNALFKKGVGAQFSMTSFLREYQRILDNIHANEDELDHNATHKKVSWKTFTTKYYIERQAHNLYNISIFRKFQIILNDVTRLQIREEESMKLYMVYQAKNYYKQEHRARLYVVQVDADRDNYSCICCKFEKDGILCCHILKVMLHLEVDKIPDKYIIDRWRKEGKKMNKPKAIPLKLDNDQLRYNVLVMKLMELGSNASKSQRKFEHLLSAMVRIQQDLIDMDMEGGDEVDEQGEQTEECSKSNRTIGTLTAMVQSGNSNLTVELLNPDKAHTKGRPRLMTIQERIKTKTFYKCSHCHDPTHTKRKCTNLDKVYEFPKKKRSRKANQTKTADAGRNYSGSGNNKETITSNLPTDMNIQVNQ